ncbi:hypothetical protein PDG61_16285 [Mycolicibacterium sp. BiH015]|uniref:hypothetical protein n=1 Tax=Mycolicibacterium sp. BiH015 TaxID=3018808 RepID=UPI0022E6BF3C|nr:hypothetical protein [Mycolicibacterium sp. BiH015]MDA2892480.1 hypothetical protein [Mycolicibacterium sp. BiH015]
MLTSVRRIMDYEMTLAEWFGAGLILGVPHAAIGVLFSVVRPEYSEHADGVAKVGAFVGSVLFWPVLLVTEVCP